MLRFFSYIFMVAGGLSFATSLAAEEAADATALEDCRSIDDDAGRLACYDRFNMPASIEVSEPAAEQAVAEPRDVASVEEPPEARQPAPEVASAEEQRTAQFGLPVDESDPENKLALRVVKCGYATDRNHYFYFDNGQIWRYLGSKKLRIRDCDRGAQINEDRFGYSLVLEGETHRMRVRRVR